MQKISFTPEERKVVLDYTAQLEKRSRYWGALRWFSVIFFILCLSLLFAVARISSRINNDLNFSVESLKGSGPAKLEAIENSLQLLETQSKLQIVLLKTEMYLFVRSFVIAVIGAGLLFYVIAEWKRDRRDRLVIRLLRLLVLNGGNEENKS